MPTRRPKPYRSPYKKTKPETPTRHTVEAIDRDDTDAGAGPEPRVPAAFEVKAKAVGIVDTSPSGGTAQKMLYTYAERGASSADVLQGAINRARKAPNRSNLERMRSVTNEVGRRRGGGSQVSKMLTQELVDELIERQA